MKSKFIAMLCAGAFGLVSTQAQAALEAAMAQMERALKLLEEAEKSPEKLAAAVAAEQAAYAALLKLSMHEFEVSKSKQNGQSSGANQPNHDKDKADLALI